MITGAIFDMDGVLLDSMPVWERAGIWYLEQNGKTPEPELIDVLFTKTMMEAAEYIREKYTISKTGEEIFHEILGIIHNYYETEIPAKEGALAFLRKLKEKGIPITVATSSDCSLAQAGLKRLGFLPYVDAVFSCCETGIGKEHPDVYLRALESMGTELRTTWVFEDSLHAVRTARKAGFPVVGIYDAGSDKNQELIQKEATVYLGNLIDFDRFYSYASRKEDMDED